MGLPQAASPRRRGAPLRADDAARFAAMHNHGPGKTANFRLRIDLFARKPDLACVSANAPHGASWVQGQNG